MGENLQPKGGVVTGRGRDERRQGKFSQFGEPEVYVS